MLDPVLTEIRRIREAFSDKHHGDVTEMLATRRSVRSQDRHSHATLVFTAKRTGPMR